MPTGSAPLSPAAADLGLGDALTAQVRDETEEQRKKRMLEAQQRLMMGPAAQTLGLGPGAGMGGLGGGLTR